MSAWEPVIGLEVHAQLLTRTKIFCGCSTKFGAAPNTHVCPTCLGLPGALPALNRTAVEMAVRAGKAFGCTISRRSIFARKNYFYPDLPKGYQISQFELPICAGGKIGNVRLTRIHLEEDAGKLVHREDASEVDLNRAGTPLIEIVSEPDLRSADEASEYLKTLRLALIYLGVNDGNLEEGSFRCDANVSVRKPGAALGTRVELKNINSFRYVKQAIEFEIARQVSLLEGGGRITQETRQFDHDKGETRPMRSKEEANDYRYFPEPDLPPLSLSQEFIDNVALPKLPQQVNEELSKAGVAAADARILIENLELLRIYEAAPPGARTASAVVNEVARAQKENAIHASFDPRWLGELFALQDSGTISSSSAKEVLAESLRAGETPKSIVEKKGLAQVSDSGALEKVVDAVLARSASEVAKYKAGNTKLLGFFVGAAMKDLKGKGNPALLNSLFKAKLGE